MLIGPSLVISSVWKSSSYIRVITVEVECQIYAILLVRITSFDLMHKYEKSKFNRGYLYVNLACLSGCPFVCLYPINVKTAEPIGPTFFKGPYLTPRKVYECLKILKICVSKFFIFVKFWRCAIKYYEIRERFLFIIYTVQREDARR